MKSSQIGPEFDCRDGTPLQAADDVPQNAAIADRGRGNESRCRKASLELFGVVRRPRAIQQAREMFEKGVGTTLRNEDQPVVRLRELRTIEVLPEVTDRLGALLV